MAKKMVIVWFDEDAHRYGKLTEEMVKAGYVFKKVLGPPMIFAVAKSKSFFTDCVLIIVEPLHFFGQEGRPLPKSLIYYIRHYAKCNAPIIFLTGSQDIKKMLEEYKDYGVAKVLKKSETFPSDLVTAIEEVSAISKK